MSEWKLQKKFNKNFSDIKVIIPKISNQEAEQGISDFNDIF